MQEKIEELNPQKEREINDKKLKEEAKKRNKKRSLSDKILGKNKTNYVDAAQKVADSDNKDFDYKKDKEKSNQEFEEGLEKRKLMLIDRGWMRSSKIDGSLVPQIVLDAMADNDEWGKTYEEWQYENWGDLIENVKRTAEAAKKLGINDAEGIKKLIDEAEYTKSEVF